MADPIMKARNNELVMKMGNLNSSMMNPLNKVIMLVKFFEKEEYARAFIKGELYMNPVKYFREHSDLGRQDADEGQPRVNIEKITYKGTDFPIAKDEPLPRFTFEGIESVNILCFSNFKLENGYYGDLNLDKAQRHLDDFGRFLVAITNYDRFKYSIFRTCIKFNYYCIHDFVQYYDSSKGDNHMWMATRRSYEPLRILMPKDKKHEWQKEYRFVIDRQIYEVSPLVLDIGNIEDFVLFLDIDKILSEGQVLSSP